MSNDTSSKSIKQRLLSPAGIGLLIFLGIWGVLEISQGHRLYVIALLLFVALLAVFRLKNFWIIAATVLIIVMIKTPTVNTLDVIIKYNIQAIQSLRHSLSNLFTPGAGKDTLPDNLQQMLSLLEQNKVTEYRLQTPGPIEDLLIVGAAWPIKNVSTAPYLLYRIGGDVDLAGCTEIDKRKDLALAYCP